MAVLSIQRSLLSITLALSLFSFANGLVGVFVPLIMLENGARLWQIPMFYVVYALVKLCFNYSVIRVIQRLGPHVGLGLGFISGALQLVFLWAFAHSHTFIWLPLGGACLALTNASLWNSQHVHISKVMSETTKSSSLATIEVVNQVLGVAAPIIGGVIGATLGTTWLLGMGTAFALAALVPLQSMGSLHEADENFEPVRYGLKGAPFRDVAANFFYNIETGVGTFVWPIYLAIEIKTFKSIGSITALSAVLAVIVVTIAGHRGDRGHDRRVMLEGSAASSVIDLARLIPFGGVGITLISVGYRASLAYMQNPWASTYYHHAKKGGIAYVLSMEIANDAANVTLWTILLGVALLASSSAMFNTAFVIAGLVAWGCLLITRQELRPAPTDKS